jgi:hypothetical protein
MLRIYVRPKAWFHGACGLFCYRRTMMKIGRASFFAGAAIFLLRLTGCPSTSPPPPGFAITVFTKPLNPGFFELHVNGTNFTPGGSVTVSYANIPNRPVSTPGSGPFPLVQSDGTIMYAEAMHCTSNDPRDASGSVFVNMKDLASGNFASANTPAAPWVCPP